MIWTPQRSHFRLRPIWKRMAWGAMALVVFLCLLGLRPRRYEAKGADLSRLAKYKFSDKFEGPALSEVPLSERSFELSIDPVFENGCRDPLLEAQKHPRANAAFVVLARNSEIDGVILSMRSLERHFNQWFNYPWVFLNDEPFDEEFKKRVLEVASGESHFGVIPPNKWKFPNGDTPEFKEAVESQGDREIMYGNMESYHSMCRFYSGYFFEHPLVKDLDWYWRVEPDVDFYCDLTYDPFVEMQRNGKKYGYTIAIKELVNTIPSLFRKTKEFIKQENIQLPDAWNFFIDNYNFFKGKREGVYTDVKNIHELITKIEEQTPLNLAVTKLESLDEEHGQVDFSLLDKQLVQALVDNTLTNSLSNVVNELYDGEQYNLCHFWSNFEIASNEVFTSPEYKAYYDFLENSNGFFTERWGDAPVHSLAVGMFLKLDEIHYFRDIGYRHSTLAHCPYNSPNQKPYKSGPKFKHQFLPEDEVYFSHPDKVYENGVGCRCRCPSDHIEIETAGGACSNKWAMLTANELRDIKLKPKTPNNYGGLPIDQMTILGMDQMMNLDQMELLAQKWLDEWLSHGKKVKNWNFTKDQRKILESLII